MTHMLLMAQQCRKVLAMMPALDGNAHFNTMAATLAPAHTGFWLS